MHQPFFLIILKYNKLSNYPLAHVIIEKKKKKKEPYTISLGLLAVRRDLIILLFFFLSSLWMSGNSFAFKR
jgi:hypothetical protein